MRRTDDIIRGRGQGQRRTMRSISDEQWHAIIANDPAYDGKFYQQSPRGLPLLQVAR